MIDDGIDDDGIATATKFLRQCRRTSSDAMASTVLMQVIARWSGRYVSSWDVIDAARELGFAVKRCCPPSNVGMIGVCRKDVQALRNIATRREIDVMRTDSVGR